MSQDKAFDQWHKRFRHLDRNDARIAWDAGIMDERRRATIQPTAAKPVAYVTRRALERESEFTVMAHPEGDSVALYTAPVAPADAVRDARRLDKFIAWFLRGGMRREIHAHGHIQQTTREHIFEWLDSPTPTEGQP